MFVIAALRRAALEVAKSSDEESRLPDEPLGTAVVRGARLEHTERAPLEIVNAVLTPLELVVQTKDFGNETGPELEGWLGALLLRDTTCDSEKHFSLSRCEYSAWVAEPFAQTGNELTRREEIRKRQCLRRRTEHRVFDGANEQRGRRASRHDDHPIACVNRRTRRREPDDGLTKHLQIGSADETCAARGRGSIHWLQATLHSPRSSVLSLRWFEVRRPSEN